MAAPISSASSSTLGMSRLDVNDPSNDSLLLASSEDEGANAKKMEVDGDPTLGQQARPVLSAARPLVMLEDQPPEYLECSRGPIYDKPAPTPLSSFLQERSVQACLGDGTLVDFLNAASLAGQDAKALQWSHPTKCSISYRHFPDGKEPDYGPNNALKEWKAGFKKPKGAPHPKGSSRRSSRGRGRPRGNKRPRSQAGGRRDDPTPPPKAPRGADGGEEGVDLPNPTAPSANSTLQGSGLYSDQVLAPNVSTIHARLGEKKHESSQRGKKRGPKSEALTHARGRGGKRGKGAPRGHHSTSASDYAPPRSDPALRPEGVPGPSGAQVMSQMMVFMTSMAERFLTPASAEAGSGNAEQNVRGRRPSRGAATPKGKGRGKGQGKRR